MNKIYAFLKDWMELLEESKSSMSIDEKICKYGVHFTCLEQDDILVQTIAKVLKEKFNVNPYEQILYIEPIIQQDESLNMSYNIYFTDDSYKFNTKSFTI